MHELIYTSQKLHIIAIIDCGSYFPFFLAFAYIYVSSIQCRSCLGENLFAVNFQLAYLHSYHMMAAHWAVYPLGSWFADFVIEWHSVVTGPPACR